MDRQRERPADIAHPGPGQESVWDYPRPPHVEDTPRHIQVVFNGVFCFQPDRSLVVPGCKQTALYVYSIRSVGDGVPLSAGRERGAAAAHEFGREHFLNDGRGADLECFFECFEAA